MPSPLEKIKSGSDHLRGTLAAELADVDLDAFSADSGQLLKFHGVYQQDDRDQRRARTRAKEPLAYSCMVRAAVPGGRLLPQQWLAIDALADEVGDGSLRLTTRQGVQYHFVAKSDLRSLIAGLNRRLVTTYAACGDVVRNVMATTAPVQGRALERLDSLARTLANRFRPHSEAYWELWVEGEKILSAGPSGDVAEPVYGDHYLPRKFKIGIAEGGDNSVDVFSQDLGFVLTDGPGGEAGALVVVGGGLGRSHKDPSTFARLGDVLGWVPDDRIGDVAEAVVGIHRDHGDREDRSHARLKYVIAERGADWARDELERRAGLTLDRSVALPSMRGGRAHLGWHLQDDGRWFLGLPVPTGRLSDSDGVRRRAAVRELVGRYATEVRITPQQDLLLCGIDGADRAPVEALLADHRVPRADQVSLSVQSTMACPALPTCGQALGEAERVLPQVADLLDELLADRGLGDLRVETRMTGCPNGCARPYVAELGIVGRTKTAYDLFVGGDAAGTRLAGLLVESVKFDHLDQALAPLLDRYVEERTPDEGFGDWAHRIGRAELAAELPDGLSGRQGATS